MSGVIKTRAPYDTYKEWDTVEWYLIRKKVKKLQNRIAKAIRERKYNKAKSLQWILTHSYYAKLLSVRRVVTNKGKKTPGVDGIIWKTSQQKLEAVSQMKQRGYSPLPLRRIYIPKKRDRRKKRPLSIPTMYDRAM